MMLQATTAEVLPKAGAIRCSWAFDEVYGPALAVTLDATLLASETAARQAILMARLPEKNRGRTIEPLTGVGDDAIYRPTVEDGMTRASPFSLRGWPRFEARNVQLARRPAMAEDECARREGPLSEVSSVVPAAHPGFAPRGRSGFRADPQGNGPQYEGPQYKRPQRKRPQYERQGARRGADLRAVEAPVPGAGGGTGSGHPRLHRRHGGGARTGRRDGARACRARTGLSLEGRLGHRAPDRRLHRGHSARSQMGGPAVASRLRAHRRQRPRRSDG